MSPLWLKSLVAGCLWLFVSVHAQAQPLFGRAVSIEATVLNADFVVIGELVEFDDEEPTDEYGRREAVIAVEETVKGQHRKRLRVRLSEPTTLLAEWTDRSSRLLVAAQEVPPASAAVIDLADKDLAVLTADFTLLRDPEDVLCMVKETLRHMPGIKRIELFLLVVPSEAVAGTKWRDYYATGGYTTLSIPVDERLEARALEYIRSDDYGRRIEGARALRYFKSPENIDRLKPLLADPGWAYLRRAEENRGIEIRHYGVRKEAYQTLKYWGEKAVKPMIRERLESARQGGQNDLINRSDSFSCPSGRAKPSLGSL